MFLLIVESDFYLLLHLFVDSYKLEFGTFSHGCLPIVFKYKHGPGEYYLLYKVSQKWFGVLNLNSSNSS